MNAVAEPPTFAEKLRALLERRKMSQADLARRSGVSQSLVEKLVQGQTGDPKASTVLKLARALGVTPNDLIGTGGEG